MNKFISFPVDPEGMPLCTLNSKDKKRLPGTKELSVVLKTDDNVFLDFLKKCLVFDPNQRITPEKALQHEWILNVSHG